MKLFFIIGLFIFLVLIICKPVEKETFVNAVIAQSPQDIQRGLMFLKHPLPRDSGMLFDFGITKLFFATLKRKCPFRRNTFFKRGPSEGVLHVDPTTALSP